ncbi:hypothetical protein M0R45_037316 [Rubus argutus]|uniref:Uncharacterized protein n=1 Tax=Rubus argutus TaxID=59490 RepID=A0AAW1VZV0_RUBAR
MVAGFTGLGDKGDCSGVVVVGDGSRREEEGAVSTGLEVLSAVRTGDYERRQSTGSGLASDLQRKRKLRTVAVVVMEAEKIEQQGWGQYDTALSKIDEASHSNGDELYSAKVHGLKKARASGELDVACNWMVVSAVDAREGARVKWGDRLKLPASQSQNRRRKITSQMAFQ